MTTHHPGLIIIGDAVTGLATLGVVFNFFSWYSDHVNVIVGTLAIIYYIIMYVSWRRKRGD